MKITNVIYPRGIHVASIINLSLNFCYKLILFWSRCMLFFLLHKFSQIYYHWSWFNNPLWCKKCGTYVWTAIQTNKLVPLIGILPPSKNIFVVVGYHYFSWFWQMANINYGLLTVLFNKQNRAELNCAKISCHYVYKSTDSTIDSIKIICMKINCKINVIVNWSLKYTKKANRSLHKHKNANCNSPLFLQWRGKIQHPELCPRYISKSVNTKFDKMNMR